MKVRFAPSPTGYLHIGGARTALFNWMYAKAQGGQFVLRIEDTDLKRSGPEFVDEILASMRWLGMDWDELYYQSKRFDIYREHAQKLLKEGLAYKDGEAIILTMPAEEIKLYDLIRGEIVFDTSIIKDQVLIKSDGSPAYSFSCVCDDALMGITCVIRGEDHISNTPKQMMIYRALGFKIPKYAHLPLIMGADGGRLSKRTGAVAVSDYQAQGFLAEAVVNYLLLLGWSPGGNQEMIPLSAAINKFSIKKINKAAAVFDLEKLKWLNGQYIKQADTAKIAALLLPLLVEKKYVEGDFSQEKLVPIVDLFKRRMLTLQDFMERADFVFLDHVNCDAEAKRAHLAKDYAEIFTLLAQRLQHLEAYGMVEVEQVFRELVAEKQLEASDLVHPIRVALTGRAVGPGLFETMAVLGRTKTVQRLQEAFQK